MRRINLILNDEEDVKEPDSPLDVHRFLKSGSVLKVSSLKGFEDVVDVPQSDYEMYDYQKRVFAWMEYILSSDSSKYPRSECRGGIIEGEMGIGKTYMSLSLIMKYREYGPSLFVVSKTIIPTIVADAKKFYPHMRVLVFHRDSLRSKIDKFTARKFYKYDLVLVTYGGVIRGSCVTKESGVVEGPYLKHQRSGKQYIYSQPEKQEPDDSIVGMESLCNITWLMIFCDESHTIANRTTKSFPAMMSLSKLYAFCLSGTPMKNKPSDILTQLVFTGLPDVQKWSNMLLQAYSNHIIQVTKEDQSHEIDLPDLHRRIVVVDFTPNEQRAFEEAAADYRNNTSIKGVTLLSRLEISPFLDKPKNETERSYRRRLRKIAGSSKYMAFKNIIETTAGGKVLAVSRFRDAVHAIKTLYPDTTLVMTGKTTNREEVLSQFREDPDIRILAFTSGTGSEGLNLSVANTVVLFDSWYNVASGEQAISRSHRNGQEEDVTVYYLLREKGIERYLNRTAADKQHEIYKALDRPYSRFEMDYSLLTAS